MKQFTIFNQLTAMPKRLAMVLTVLFTLGVGSMLGATTKTISSFTTTSGKTGDVTYTAYKGGGTSDPAVNSNAIRLYQNANGNTGGYIVLSVPEGYKITSATIKSTMATTTGYYIASNPGNSTPAKANFVVSNKSLSVNTEYTVSGLSTQYITFACFGTKSSSRLYVSYLSVTYQSPAAKTYNVILSRNGVTETINDVEEGKALDYIDGTGDQGACSPEWVFEGWSKTQRPAQNNTAVMDLVTTVDGAGPYYAVYSHTDEDGGGNTTATMSSFSEVSGNVNNDVNVSYEAAKGDAGTAPAINSSQIRIYQNGGTLTITGNNGKKLTSITIGSSMKTSVSYKIDGGTESSNQSIAANGKFTLSEIEASSVLFTCKGTDKNSRLYLNHLSVTYSGGNTVYYTTSPECTTETTVTLNLDGGSFDSKPDGWDEDGNNYKKEGVTGAITLPTPTKTGYNFDGWYDDETKVNSPYTPSKTVTLVAKWTAIQTTITLDANGGSGNTSSVAATYGQPMPNITIPTRAGYDFQGYFTENDGTGTQYYKADGTSAKNWDKTAATTLYAQWTLIEYTLSLESTLKCADNGSITIAYNATSAKTFSAATRDDYTCTGYWSAPSGGVQVLNADGSFAGNDVNDFITDGKWINTTAKKLTPRWETEYKMILSKGTEENGTYTLSTTNIETSECATSTTRQVTITATPNTGYEVDQITYSGAGTATKKSGPTLGAGKTTWVYTFAENDKGTGTFTVTFKSLPKYTITFSTGTNNPTIDSMEGTSETGITLPIGPTPTCTDWAFAGWATASVTETTTEPTLLSQGNNYKPTEDCTLYAVYSYTEAGGGGSGFYLSVTKDAATYYIGEKGSGAFLSAVTDVNSAATFNIENNQYLYYGNKTYVSSTANSTSLTIATTTPTVTWAITDEGETITFKSNGTGGRYLAFNYNNGSPRFSSYGNTYTYELTKHTTSTTTYNSNPTCLVPVWDGATIDKTALTVNCGERSSMDGAAQITFSKDKIYGFSNPIIIEASEGFLVSTSRTPNGNYQQSVSQSPLVGTEYPNTFNGKFVYVRAEAPAQSDTDLEGTITIKNNKGETLQTFSVTADVSCTTYTLTLDDRGTKTTAEYYAGASVPKPADPEGVCTDPINYVFDGWSLNPVTDENTTSYEKVTFPFDMPAEKKTLHAVYRYTEGNTDSDKFMSVDKEIGELVNGMDYVLTGYNTDDKEYALSCIQYESGKYKTKQIDVSESTTMYDEENPYYELTTTDNEIIWTITGDDEDGYSFQNKATGKYLNIKDGSLALNNDEPTKYTIEHYVGYDSESGKYVQYLDVIIQPSDDASNYLSSYYKNSTAGVLFNLHNSSTLKLYLYKRAAATLYTTSPACGPMLEITSGKDIYVTSGFGTGRNTVIAQQTVEYRATRLKTQNGSAEGTAPDVKVAANGVTMGGVVTDKVKVVKLTQNKEQIGDKYTITGTVTVQYTPTANNLQEEIQVQLAVDYNSEAKDNFTVHARSLPAEFVIVAKSSDKWYALNADMSSSKAQPANGQVKLNDLNNPTKADFAPCNTIYTFDGMVDGGNREYMRFQGIDGKYLWAASEGNTGIQNYAKNTPAGDNKAYNWKLYTEDNITYRFGNANSSRQLTLSGEKFGMYASGVQDIRILPYEAKCIYNYAPTNLKVSVLKSTSVTLTWDAVVGATKYQYSTNATNWTDCGTEPTATINDLTGGTKYTYYIRAHHEDAGVSQECIDYAEITFTTANCDDVPTNITYTADLNSITVSWTAAAPTATITYNTKEDGTGGGGTIENATSPRRISGGLNPNTTYYIQILADGTCASPIIPVKTEDVEVDIVEWYPQGIIVDINTDETIGVTLENEVSYGSGLGSLAEDLFFSKYFEGSGSLKMIAIYNGTGKDVDLTDYFIYKGHDGSANIDADDEDKILYPLSELGVIKQGQEIVLYSWPLNTDAEASVYSCSQTFLHSIANESGQDANPRWILCGKDPTNSITPIYSDAMNFNGDDPLLLYKDDEIIDVFGATEGESPEDNVICDGYNENGNYKTRRDESWVANDVSNMDYGKTAEDFPGGEIPDDVNVDDPTITAYTARVIMFRKNTVTSGTNAVTKNTDDFHTFAEEWEVRQVCRVSGDGDLTCAAYQELGTFDYSDYYTKYESMGEGTTFEENDRNADGTVTIPITDLYKHACSNIRVKLTNSNGDVLTDREYKVPIMITTTQGTDGQAFIDLRQNLATKEVDGEGNVIATHPLALEDVREICKTCDVVVRDNATLMKMADDAANDHPQVRNIYVYENSSLIVPNGTNYTINNLSLRRKGDEVSSLSAYPDALKLPESAAAPISLDFRLSAENWHWFTLPYNCNINEVTWADGTPAQYNTDWYLMTYDGQKRAETQAGGCWKAYTGTTINAGDGFIIAINGNINNPAHTYELHFPMSKEVLAAEGIDKIVAVRAWGVETNIRPNHKGWNLVGNPYLAYYQRDNITNFDGLRLGELKGPDPQTGYWEQTGDVPYVVVPVGAGWIAYEQVFASETDLLPFTAYFVQVGNDGKHDSSDELSISFDHTKLQLSATPMPASIVRRAPSEVNETEEPVIVGVALTNSLGESDKTSLVIADRFTNEYEMQADFFKWFGDYYNYYTKPVLYTIGADQGKRAFNALNEELAKQPIPMGMYAAQAGNYTFSLNQQFDLSRVEEVWLYDATQSTYTNLMQSDYTFSTSKVNGAGRFSLSVKLAPKVATSIDNVTADKVWATTHTKQVIVNGLENGMHLWLYDATGKLLYNEPTSNYQHTYSVPQTGTYFVSVMNGNQKQTIKVVVE